MIVNEAGILIRIEKGDIRDGKLILEGVEGIGPLCFSGNEDLEDIEVKPGVRVISSCAFQNCSELKFVSLPESVFLIAKEVFWGCSALESIKLPSRIKTIEMDTFSDCISLKEVLLPNGLTTIGTDAFENCSKLQKIKLPQSLEAIGTGAFQLCSLLNEIQLPENLKTLGSSAFLRSGITKIILPNNLEVINNYTFENCVNLEEVQLPKDLRVIYSSAFEKCKKLSNIIIPNKLQAIGSFAFEGCASLNEAILPDSLIDIDIGAFKDCSNLSKVRLSAKIDVIEDSCFENCSSLREVVIPQGVKRLGKKCFKGCSLLSEVKIPSSLEKIGKFAFEGCRSLEKIEIENTQIERGVFDKCEKLKEIKLGANAKMSCQAPGFISYLTKKDGYFYLTEDRISKDSFLLAGTNLDVDVFVSLWEERENIQLYNKDANVLNSMCSILDREKFADLYHNHNFKFFNQVKFGEKREETEISYLTFCKMFYNLGGFNLPVVENVTTKSGKQKEVKIDYAQKVGEFIKAHFGEKKLLNESSIFRTFASFKPEGLKKDFTDFLLEKNNFEIMFKKGRAYFSKCYNEFEFVQLLNTSDKGSQRQLKPTLEIFDEYVNRKQFKGINDENRELADVISKFYTSQSEFDDALEIMREWKREGCRKQILTNTTKDPFENIEKLEQNIINVAREILLGVEQNFGYTYEWLDKDNPYNFVLGKLTSCCAHLDGAGYGIMKASIVNPDIQNLVFRQRGEIIGKATLYVNREGGYGLVNTAEISDKISLNEKKFIYGKLKLAVRNFAEEYNHENPNKPLKLVNIGMGSNRLSYYIQSRDKKSDKILQSPVYATYGKKSMNYNCDSDLEQYIIWEKED